MLFLGLKLKTMKNFLILFMFAGLIALFSCSTGKKITEKDLNNNNIIIIGTIEYDYSELIKKNIKGIKVFITSDNKQCKVDLSERNLPQEKMRRREFISIIGTYGDYSLAYNYPIASQETENLKNLMDMDANQKTNTSKIIVEKYSIRSGKIINLGKIIVKYKGGQNVDGKINYSYVFDTNWEDTLALNTFKIEYPEIFRRYIDDVYSFKDDIQMNLEYIVKNLSEEKGKILSNFINEQPEKTKILFNNLNNSNKEFYLNNFQKLSDEEFKTFLESK